MLTRRTYGWLLIKNREIFFLVKEHHIQHSGRFALEAATAKVCITELKKLINMSKSLTHLYTIQVFHS